MSVKRDAGGTPLTDYSKSPIAPERAKKLNAAELDYVNGIAQNDGTLHWPSYSELAMKYGIPVRVINEQAGKHKWVSRREARKTALIVFKNEQTRKQWLDMDREVMGAMQGNMAKMVYVVSRLVDEQRMLVDKSIAEEAGLRAAGEHDAVVRTPIRIAEAEAMMRTAENVVKTAERLHARIQALPTILPDAAAPAPLPSVAEEEKEAAADRERELPLTTVEAVYREILALQQGQKVVESVVLYDDDEDFEDEPTAEEKAREA